MSGNRKKRKIAVERRLTAECPEKSDDFFSTAECPEKDGGCLLTAECPEKSAECPLICR